MENTIYYVELTDWLKITHVSDAEFNHAKNLKDLKELPTQEQLAYYMFKVENKEERLRSWGGLDPESHMQFYRNSAKRVLNLIDKMRSGVTFQRDVMIRKTEVVSY